MTNRKTESFVEHRAHDAPADMSSDRAFGLVFTVVFSLVGVYLYLGDGPAWTPAMVRTSAAWPFRHLIAGGVATVFLVAALALPDVLHPLNVMWMKLGRLLHRVVSPVVLGLLFLVAFVPMGLILRWTGRDLLRLRWDPAAASYWIERNPPGPPPETMKNQF